MKRWIILFLIPFYLCFKNTEAAGDNAFGTPNTFVGNGFTYQYPSTAPVQGQKMGIESISGNTATLGFGGDNAGTGGTGQAMPPLVEGATNYVQWKSTGSNYNLANSTIGQLNKIGGTVVIDSATIGQVTSTNAIQAPIIIGVLPGSASNYWSLVSTGNSIAVQNTTLTLKKVILGNNGFSTGTLTFDNGISTKAQTDVAIQHFGSTFPLTAVATMTVSFPTATWMNPVIIVASATSTGSDLIVWFNADRSASYAVMRSSSIGVNQPISISSINAIGIPIFGINNTTLRTVKFSFFNNSTSTFKTGEYVATVVTGASVAPLTVDGSWIWQSNSQIQVINVGLTPVGGTMGGNFGQNTYIITNGRNEFYK